MTSARVRSRCIRKVSQTECLCSSLVGKDSPKIHQDFPRRGHHRFLSGGDAQRQNVKHVRPFLERLVFRLPAFDSPYHICARCSHLRISAVYSCLQPDIFRNDLSKNLVNLARAEVFGLCWRARKHRRALVRVVQGLSVAPSLH